MPGHGLVTPDASRRPKSSCIRFAAGLPNECWQSGFIHWHLAGGRETGIISRIDDHSRYALPVTDANALSSPVCARSGFPGSSTAQGGGSRSDYEEQPA